MTDTATEAPPSLVSQIAALAVGETVTISKRLPPTAKGTDVAAARERLHNTGRSAMARAKAGKPNSRTYTGEIGGWVTGSGHSIACFAITRTANGK